MRRFRVGKLTAIAVVAAVPLLFPSSAVVGGVAGAALDPAPDVPALDVPGGVTAEPALAGRYAHVELRTTGNRAVAWVDLARVSGTVVLVTVRATGLTPGFHGIHIHAKGVCDPTGTPPFASAGPHFNPTGDAEGMQAGAFPVLLVGPNGSGYAAFTDGNFALDQLTGPAGTSIVIHSGPDNYGNIPARYTAAGTPGPDAETMATGDAGSRHACGVLSAPGTGTFLNAWRSHAWT